jgi:hypothetical protein
MPVGSAEKELNNNPGSAIKKVSIDLWSKW